jgi:hypothetical protein
MLPARNLVVNEIEHFLTGERTHVSDLNRVLATVLFTDIVNSTKRAVEVGDRKWRSILDEHDTAFTRIVERFHGRRIKCTGDGILATFDGPARAVKSALAIRDEACAIGIEIRTGAIPAKSSCARRHQRHRRAHRGADRSRGRSGEILVSRTVTDLVVGSGIEFESRGRLRAQRDSGPVVLVLGLCELTHGMTASLDDLERESLCGLMDELGPDAPTLLAPWTTRDLAAHLVIREHDLWAAPGLVIPGAWGRFAERRRDALTHTDYSTLLAMITIRTAARVLSHPMGSTRPEPQRVLRAPRGCASRQRPRATHERHRIG